MGTGYKYMMTTKFTAPATDTQTSGEYVTIDILTNSTISSEVRNIPIPYVLNLSATQYSCAATNWNTGTSFFTQTRDPDMSLSSGPILTPLGLSSTGVATFRNRSIHIVSKLATLEEMGVTEIYNDNPFSDVIGQEAYAFGSKRLNVDFSDFGRDNHRGEPFGRRSDRSVHASRPIRILSGRAYLVGIGIQVKQRQPGFRVPRGFHDGRAV